MGSVPPFMKRLQHPAGHFPSGASDEAKELYSNGSIVVRNKNNYEHLRKVFVALGINFPDTVDPEILFQTLQEQNDARAILPVEPELVEAEPKKKRPRNVSEALALRDAKDHWEDSFIEAPEAPEAPALEAPALEAAENKVESIDSPALKKQNKKKTPVTKTRNKTSVKDVSNI